MQKKITELKRLLQEASDLSAVSSVLGWDQQVFMPPGGANARGRQMAILAQLTQERAANPRIGQLLDELEPVTQKACLMMTTMPPWSARPGASTSAM